MRNIFFIIFIFFFLAIGCKKKTVEPLYGTISSFTFDGKPMQRPGTKLQIAAYNITSRCNISEYTISITNRASNDTLNEMIYMSALPMFKTGVIFLSKSLVSCDTVPEAGFIMSNSDLAITSYRPLKNFDNYVNILSFDDKTKEVKGRCKLTLVNNTYSQYQKQFGYRDTIVFESGDFTVRLQ